MPITGFKLYSLDVETGTVVEQYDGSNLPEVITYEVTGLSIDKDY